MTPLFLTTSTKWSVKTFTAFIPPSSNSPFWPIFTRKFDSAMFLLTVPQLLPITRSALRILRTLLVAKVPISQLVCSISTCACGAHCAMGLDLNFYTPDDLTNYFLHKISELEILVKDCKSTKVGMNATSKLL